MADAAPTVLGRTFAALRHRNYQLWFTGQTASLLGTWMQVVAQGFLIFQLTRSPAYLGYAGFAYGLPAWAFTLYGGVVADRVPRRTVLLVTQTFMMLLAFLLAGLTFSGAVRPWHILVLTFGLGVANAFDSPARLALVRELVDREDMTNAIALNAIMFNTATAVGPAAAGVVYAFAGPGWCFTINGVSFLAVIAALAAMRITTRPEAGGSARADLGEGVRYAATHPVIRTLIVTVGAASLFGISVSTLMPAWAVRVLGGDATTNGLLQSARGLGALLGGFVLASIARHPIKGRLITAGTFAFPIMLLLLSAARWTPASLVVLVAVGASVVLVMNAGNALVQTLVPDRLRGRVMSVYSLVFFGTMPIGSLAAGIVAQHLGEPTVVAGAGVLALAYAAAVYLMVPEIRVLQ